ncbi:MAG: flagellar basal body P-ring formation chaperone FlgA [Ectothiorhodospiraceae bacterium]
MKRVGRAVVVLVGMAASLASANEQQPLDEIRQAVAEHARSGLDDASGSVEVGRIDSRLRLPRCGHDLETFDPPGRGSSSRATVGVECHEPSPWRLYVSVRITQEKAVLVAAEALPRGTILSESHLRAVERNVNRLSRGYYVDPEDVVGMQTGRPLREGDLITASRIEARRLVERGQRVLITAGSAVTEISMNGEALEPGRRGERVRVRNSSSGRVVEGEVVADSRVRIQY